MSFQIIIPAPGESINEVIIGQWLKKDGESVNKDEPILEIESEKASLELVAEQKGILKIMVKEGDKVSVGSVAGEISEDLQTQNFGKKQIVAILAPQPGESINEVILSNWNIENGATVQRDQEIGEIESEKASLPVISEADGVLEIMVSSGETIAPGTVLAKVHINPNEKNSAPSAILQSADKIRDPSEKIASPAAAKILREKGIDPESVQGMGKAARITKEDAERATLPATKEVSIVPATILEDSGKNNLRKVRREKMTTLRKKISERLVSVKNHTAMLTTFNEMDMSRVMETRANYKEIFKEKHNIGLGFMSFFSKACAIALTEFPFINSQIDGAEVINHDYVDLGIAVNAPKGLMVPILRNAEDMSLAKIEQTIVALAKKARNGKLSIDEMTGGTFTITNGGVFGSMLSTPILNPPQSAILGMHNIVQRPVAVNGEVKIRPIMYSALSYDHRIIDGKDSVGFLVRIKQLIEDPVRMILEA